MALRTITLLTSFFRKEHVRHVLVLLAATVLMFGDVLFVAEPPVLSIANTDTYRQFLPLRSFTAGELRQGNIPLWNPHVFSGMPHLGNFENAVFYPLNAVFFLMSPARAINVLFALHIFLAGLFMYAWLRARAIAGTAALFASLLFMFSGSVFLHIFPGHLSNISSMAWVPLLFLAAERIADTLSLRWCVVALCTVAMQILGGHIQYVYYTALIVLLYSALNAGQKKNLPAVLLRWAGIYAGAVLVTAVQFFPALDLLGESVRTRADYAFSALFSFAPENIATLFVPFLMGDLSTFVYWGQCTLWEMALFIGVTGFLFAVYAAVKGERLRRRWAVTMFIVCMVLALGKHTPLFGILFHAMPLFGMFRGTAKFSFFAGIFLTLLAGIGMDAFLRDRRHARVLGIIALAGAAAAAVATASLSSLARDFSPDSLWYSFVSHVLTKGEVYNHYILGPEFGARTAMFASGKIVLLAATLAVLGVFLLLEKKWRFAAYAVMVVGVLEVFAFARSVRPVFPMESTGITALRRFAQEHPGDFRVFNAQNPGASLAAGMSDIYGEGSNMLQRYGHFMAFTQGVAPDRATNILELTRLHRLFRILRLRYLFHRGQVTELPGGLPRALIVRDWQVIRDRDAVFTAMAQKDFLPERTVFLEEDPGIAPAGGEGEGAVSVRNVSTDEIAVAAELSAPGILLLTDSYSRHWRALSLEGAASRYRVMPADSILTAVPLEAGKHHFMLEYDPPGYRWGKRVSLASLAMLALLVAVVLRRKTA